MRLDQAKDRSIQNTWKPLQNAENWCNLKLAQERGLQFYQTRSHEIVLYDTVPAVCIEKAVCVKTKEELHQEVRLTLRLSLVVLEANLHSGQQDQRDQDARSSWDPPSESKSYRETWNNAVDYRILGTPISTVEQKDTNRHIKVKKLIEKFETNQHKESFLQDFSQTQKINKFSKESQDCNTYWEIGIVYCSCGSIFFLKKTRRDETSSKRTTTTSPQSLAMVLRRVVAVPNMDLLNDKGCTTKLKTCCTKLVKRNMEDTHPFLRGDTATTRTEIR